jgi:hypothetical protein
MPGSLSGASPGAGDELYLDWVSPLQEPRGPASTDFAPPSEAFRELDPSNAFVASGQKARSPLSIPEPRTIALIGTAILPLTGFLLRRRR